MTVFKLYKYLSIPTIFIFYSYGEELNLLGRINFFYFFLLNFTFSLILFRKRYLREGKYLFIYTVYIFILIFSLIRNYLSVDLVIDYFQILNLLFILIIFSSEEWQGKLNEFIRFTIPIAILAGIFSHYYYGIKLGLRFQPISNIIFAFLFFQLIFTKLTVKKKIVISLLSLLVIINILGSGRRTNLILILFNIVFFLLFYKPKLIYFFTLVVFIFLASINFSTDFLLKGGDSLTQKRLALAIEEGAEFGQRGREVISAFNTFKKDNSIINYILGYGSGGKYQYSSFLSYDIRKHIHFTPMSLYFRYGIFGIIFFLTMLGSLIYTFRKIKSKKTYSLLFMCLFITFFDSLFRSTLVDYYSIIFLGLIFLKKKNFDFIFAYRENSRD